MGVHPTMLRKNHPLASVDDVFNAVYIEGQPIGEAMFYGRGAGRFPTASAVCGDIIECARNIREGCNGRVGCTCYEEKALALKEEVFSQFYVRLLVDEALVYWHRLPVSLANTRSVSSMSCRLVN